MTTVQGINKNNYNYEAIDTIEKSGKTIESAAPSQTFEDNTSKPLAEMSNSKVILDYTQKLKDKIKQTEISEDIEDSIYLKLALELKESIEELVNKITENDIKKIIQKNYNPEKLSIDLFVKIINQNKVAVKTMDIEKLEKEIEKEISKLQENFKDIRALKEIITSLKKNNIPTNKKNIEKIQEVINKAVEIKDLSNEVIINLIKQNKEFTIENIYKAKYTTQNTTKAQDNLEKLEPQIKDLLKEIGLRATKENITFCKLLINNNIPVDKETFEYVKALKSDLKGLKTDKIIEKATENILQNKKPAEIIIGNNLIKGEKQAVSYERVKEIIRQLPKIKEIHIEKVIKNNQILNLENLLNTKYKTERENNDTLNPEQNKKNIGGLDKSVEINRVRASLYLEELRLKMTIEAAQRLNIKGINIETKPLEEIVENLKELEKEVYEKELLTYSVPVTKENINQVEATFEKINIIKNLSPKTIKNIMNNEIDFTIKDLANSETSKKIIDKAMENYELLNTKPRKDLGDSIEKTFSKIEVMLEELGIEANNANIKAAKILAYNEMPMDIHNIEMVKLIDLKVNTIATKLTPSIVVNMIKENLSPIDLHIDEVIDYINEFIQKTGFTPDEQIAETIYNLEQNKELTLEEREGLIGIYRMLSTVSKSKGAAVGFLIKNNLPLSLNNLFEAAKYINNTKKEGSLIKADIDDDFGILTELKYKGKNIKEQIKSAIFNKSSDFSKDMLHIIKELEEDNIKLDTQNLTKAELEIKIIENLLDASSEEQLISLYKKGYLESESFSLEELIEEIYTINKNANQGLNKQNEETNQIENKESYQEIQENKEFGEIIERLKAIIKINPDTLKTFQKLDLKNNIDNLFIAKELEDDPFTFIKKLDTLFEELEKASLDTMTIKKEIFKEKNIIEEYNKNLLEIKKQLDNLKNDILDRGIIKEEGVNSQGVNKAITETTKFIEYQKALNDHTEYYQIPIQINGKTHQMNMYYFNEKEKDKINKENSTMNIYLYFQTETMGKIQANIQLKNEKMDFKIFTNNIEDMELIKGFHNKINQLLKETDFKIGEIDYGFFEAKSPINEQIKRETKEPIKKHKESKFETTI